MNWVALLGISASALIVFHLVGLSMMYSPRRTSLRQKAGGAPGHSRTSVPEYQPKTATENVDPSIIKKLQTPEMLTIPTDLCEKARLVVTAVYTVPKDASQRAHARSVMAKVTNGRYLPVFPLGRSRDDAEIDNAVLEESKVHGDILLGDFVDSYEALPMKTLMSTRWFAECGNKELLFLLKHDEDVAINWSRLGRVLRDLASGSEILDGRKPEVDPMWLGFVLLDSAVIHDPSHKNYEEYLTEFSFFPPYTSGPAYLLNKIVSQRIVKEASSLPIPLRNEDAMLGILLNNTGIVPMNRDEFIPSSDPYWFLSPCKRKILSIKDCDCDSWWSVHAGKTEGRLEGAQAAALACSNE